MKTKAKAQPDAAFSLGLIPDEVLEAAAEQLKQQARTQLETGK